MGLGSGVHAACRTVHAEAEAERPRRKLARVGCLTNTLTRHQMGLLSCLVAPFRSAHSSECDCTPRPAVYADDDKTGGAHHAVATLGKHDSEHRLAHLRAAMHEHKIDV